MVCCGDEGYDVYVVEVYGVAMCGILCDEALYDGYAGYVYA